MPPASDYTPRPTAAPVPNYDLFLCPPQPALDTFCLSRSPMWTGCIRNCVLSSKDSHIDLSEALYKMTVNHHQKTPMAKSQIMNTSTPAPIPNSLKMALFNVRLLSSKTFI